MITFRYDFQFVDADTTHAMSYGWRRTQWRPTIGVWMARQSHPVFRHFAQMEMAGLGFCSHTNAEGWINTVSVSQSCFFFSFSLYAVCERSKQNQNQSLNRLSARALPRIVLMLSNAGILFSEYSKLNNFRIASILYHFYISNCISIAAVRHTRTMRFIFVGNNWYCWIIFDMK